MKLFQINAGLEYKFYCLFTSDFQTQNLIIFLLSNSLHKILLSNCIQNILQMKPITNFNQ